MPSQGLAIRLLCAPFNPRAKAAGGSLQSPSTIHPLFVRDHLICEEV
jgi:hypothetical protein